MVHASKGKVPNKTTKWGEWPESYVAMSHSGTSEWLDLSAAALSSSQLEAECQHHNCYYHTQLNPSVTSTEYI